MNVPPPAPSAPPRHIVAVGGLVREPATGRVLLIRSPRRDWEFPGGQVEEGESITHALVREVFEETGITVSVGALVGVYSNVQSKIVMFGFLCDQLSGEPTPGPESLEVEWVAHDEALARVTRPPLYYRLRDMLTFNGQVVYRAYEFGASDEATELQYVVREERWV